MASGNDGLQALREALRLSPDNVPLRQYLAESLMSRGHADQAEQEYRQALALAPDNLPLKVGLAQAFYHQGKHSQALVLVEDLIKNPHTPASAYLLYARLLFNEGNAERAVRQYREAIALDPAVADVELAERLGVGADSATADVVEGRVRAAWEDPAS